MRFEERTAWISVRHAAGQLHVSRQRVYQLIKAGALTARQSSGTWLVSALSVDGRVELLRSQGPALDADR